MTDQDAATVIIGGGWAGLNLAHWLATLAPEQAYSLKLLEAAPRTGGLVWTETERGYLVESGPQGWMGAAPGVTRLAEDLGLDEQIIKVKLTDHPRYVARKGQLHPLPQSPAKVAFTGLASPRAKFRLLKEFWTPAVQEQGLSVTDWATRRFGKGLLPVFDAMATGIYAGDINRISVDHTFSTLRALERKEGSLLNFARKNRSQLAGSRLAVPLKGMGDMTGKLTAGIAAAGVELATDTKVERVTPSKRGFTVKTDQETLEADKVALALGPNEARRLLPERETKGWPDRRTAPIAVVGLGLPADSFARPLRGFGALIPHNEGAFSLGTLFPSTALPQRAPEGHHLMQSLVGGVRQPEKVTLSDEELVRGCLADLARYFKFTGDGPPEPAFSKVIRHPVGIPQLELGHERLLSSSFALEQKYSGLHFTGMGYETVAIGALSDKTRVLAHRILGLEPPSPPAPPQRPG